MNPIERKLLISLASFWEQWGKAPTIKQLAGEAQLCEVAVYRGLESLETIGWIKFQRRMSVAGYPNNFGAQLTVKAEKYLPRLRELQ